MNDHFRYYPKLVEAIIENYHALWEDATRNPCCSGATMLYDLSRALDVVRMTPAQEEAFRMRLDGLTYTEIGYILGVRRQSVTERVKRAEKKITDFLVGPLRGRGVSRVIGEGGFSSERKDAA